MGGGGGPQQDSYQGGGEGPGGNGRKGGGKWHEGAKPEGEGGGRWRGASHCGTKHKTLP